MRVFENVVRGFSLVHDLKVFENVVRGFSLVHDLKVFENVVRAFSLVHDPGGSHYKNPDEANPALNLREN